MMVTIADWGLNRLSQRREGEEKKETQKKKKNNNNNNIRGLSTNKCFCVTGNVYFPLLFFTIFPLGNRKR